jgi:hypothetical protein
MSKCLRIPKHQYNQPRRNATWGTDAKNYNYKTLHVKVQQPGGKESAYSW